MHVVEDFICANRAMHEQFRAVAQVLSLFVQEQARGLSLVRLQRETQRPVAELRQICIDLTQLQLLRRQVGRGERWMLAREAASITLEDAYDCLMLAQTEARAAGAMPAASASVTAPTSASGLKGVKATDVRTLDVAAGCKMGVDIVIMQAAMGINQSTRQHLRHFHLDRLLRGVA